MIRSKEELQQIYNTNFNAGDVVYEYTGIFIYDGNQFLQNIEGSWISLEEIQYREYNNSFLDKI